MGRANFQLMETALREKRTFSQVHTGEWGVFTVTGGKFPTHAHLAIQTWEVGREFREKFRDISQPATGCSFVGR